jgi:NADH-quinone oxidoreductase subunit M
MFPFHTWLPDAHVEAPTAGSVILAAVLLKMGTYGFLRFSLPLLPQGVGRPDHRADSGMLSIIGIIYGALVCLMQKDWKKLVAYSSVSHLGFCTLGIFSMNPNGIAGSVLQQVNHGISTGMLFMVIGVIYERRHTREISEYGGLAHVMPKFAIIFAIAMLSSAGLPLLNGFVGEFTILQGAFEANRWWAAFAVTGVILGAAYLLWLYQRTMLGQVTNGKNLTIPDMNFREVAMFVPLIAWAIWIGVYPKPLLRRSAAAGHRDRGARASGILQRQPAAARGWRRREARDDRFLLHRHRPLLHRSGAHAGAVRLRHPAVRFSDLPRSAAAQVAADFRRAGRRLHRLSG